MPWSSLQLGDKPLSKSSPFYHFLRHIVTNHRLLILSPPVRDVQKLAKLTSCTSFKMPGIDVKYCTLNLIQLRLLSGLACPAGPVAVVLLGGAAWLWSTVTTVSVIMATRAVLWRCVSLHSHSFGWVFQRLLRHRLSPSRPGWFKFCTRACDTSSRSIFEAQFLCVFRYAPRRKQWQFVTFRSYSLIYGF